MKRFLLLCMSLLTFMIVDAQRATGFGQWQIVYMQDEFGDTMYDSPILGCEIPSTSDKGFVLSIGLTNSGFYFQVYSSKYNNHAFDKPVTLKIKDSQNKVHTFLIPTDNMDEDMMFIYDASEVKQLVRLLDAGHLRFSISGHLRMSSYNSAPTTYSFLDTIQTKGLVDAIQRYF